MRQLATFIMVFQIMESNSKIAAINSKENPDGQVCYAICIPLAVPSLVPKACHSGNLF